MVLVFALVAVLSAAEKQRRQRNRAPVIESFTSSVVTVQVCPFVPDKPDVDLMVNATDPDGDELHYEYSTTDGKISGEGKLVVWDLNKVRMGPHEVRVTVTDGKWRRHLRYYVYDRHMEAGTIQRRDDNDA